MKSFLIFLFSILFFSAFGQLTKSRLPGQSAPEASIEDFSWISGNWEGQGLGGTVHEIWSKPAGGAMMGSFRLIKDGEIQFYELCILREYSGSVKLQIKHFDNELVGWEEQHESKEFTLVDFSDDIAFFEEFTFERVDEDNLNIYVLIGAEEDEKEVKFSYTRK